jgi:hypothetical protein
MRSGTNIEIDAASIPFVLDFARACSSRYARDERNQRERKQAVCGAPPGFATA